MLHQVTWMKEFQWLYTQWIAVIITSLYIPFINLSKHLSSKSDVNNKPLEPGRVQAAQLLILLLVLQITLWDSINGFEDILPV